MKRLVLLATRLYPRAWRERYGQEFEVLLEDSKAAGVRELFDVLKGATTMRLSRSPLQMIGIFTLAGTLFMVVVWAAIPNMYRSAGTFAIPKVGGDGPATIAVAEAAGDVLEDRQLQTFMHKYGVDSRDDLEMAKRKIHISKALSLPGRTNEQVIEVGFDDKDPAKAQAVAKDVMDRLALRLNAKGIDTNVIGSPQQPTSPAEPALKKLLEMGVVGGLMLGVLAAIARKLATRAAPSAS